MHCQAYQPNQADAWNAFVAQSRNGTFLVNRHYMDYHAHRFQDASVWVMDNDLPLAVLPANRIDEVVVAHGGLTFAGLVWVNKLGVAQVLAVFDCLRDYFANLGVKRLLYKPVPHIYHSLPAEEDLYALFKQQAKLIRMDVSTTIDQAARLPLAKGRKHGLSKARKAGVVIKPSQDYVTAWQLLSDTLAERHAVSPTHSVDEIQALARQFTQIQLFMAYYQALPVAAVVIYEYQQVAHTQYMAVNALGREIGALDLLIETLITDTYANHRYFNFGISTEQQGQVLNAGLCAQKEMFGGRTTVLQWFEMECV